MKNRKFLENYQKISTGNFQIKKKEFQKIPIKKENFRKISRNFPFKIFINNFAGKITSPGESESQNLIKTHMSFAYLIQL